MAKLKRFFKRFFFQQKVSNRQRELLCVFQQAYGRRLQLPAGAIALSGENRSSILLGSAIISNIWRIALRRCPVSVSFETSKRIFFVPLRYLSLEYAVTSRRSFQPRCTAPN